MLAYRERISRPAWWVSVPATVLLPLAVALLTLGGTVAAAQDQPEARPLDAVGVALLLAGAVILVVRTWNPSAIVGAAALSAAGYFAAGYPGGPAFLAAVVALCSAVVSGHRRSAYTVTAIVFGLLLVLHIIRFPGEALPLFGPTGWLSSLVTIIAGAELWRARSERLTHARTARAEAELRQVTEERLRLARELHDSLGHHVSLINVQAGVALYLLDENPEQARGALTAITKSSAELLSEMRSTPGVLRGVDEEPSRQPVAGLARLDDLAAESRAAGLATVQVLGDTRELPPSVDQAAYRIVQEALTNTRKHANADTATVLVTYDEDGLTVEISDDGRGAPAHRPHAASGGNGLPGMRERASALGGTLSVCTGERDGFRVQAHLPTAPMEVP